MELVPVDMLPLKPYAAGRVKQFHFSVAMAILVVRVCG